MKKQKEGRPQGRAVYKVGPKPERAPKVARFALMGDKRRQQIGSGYVSSDKRNLKSNSRSLSGFDTELCAWSQDKAKPRIERSGTYGTVTETRRLQHCHASRTPAESAALPSSRQAWRKAREVVDWYGSVLNALVPGRTSPWTFASENNKAAKGPSYGSVLNALVPGRKSVLVWLLSSVFVLATTLAHLIPSTPAHAAINEQLNFQARLLNASGGLVPDGFYNVQFNIYSGGDGDPSTGDESLEWTGSHMNDNSDGVRVVNGYLSVQLGSSVSQTNTLADVDWNDSTLWLSINIGDTGSGSSCATEANFNSNCGGDGEMDPFMRLTSVPYAFNANRLDNLDSTQFVQLGQGTQTDATTNSSIAINKTGATGDILTLQDGGTTELLFNQDGDLTIGSASDNGRLILFDGSSNTGTFVTAALGSDRVYTFPDATGTVVLDTTLATTAFLQNGNSFSATAVLGTNDNNSLVLETVNTTALTIDTSQNVTLVGTLAVNGDAITSDGALSVTSATSNALTLDSGTTGAINIGANANAKTITIGNETGATSLELDSGTGNINIGNGAQARTINLGTGAAVVQTINIGGTGANVVAIANTQTGGSVAIGAAMTTGTITIGGTGAQTGTIAIGTGTGAQAINLGTGGTGVKTIAIGGSAANVITIGDTQTGGSISLGAAMTTGTINIGGTGAQTGTIGIGTGTGAQTINLATGAAAKTVVLGSTNTTSSTTIAAGSGNIIFNASVAQFSEVTGTRTLTAQTRTTNVAGTNLTVQAGTAGAGGSAFSGGLLTLQGGSAGGTGNANGGNVNLVGGLGTGTGVKGLVVIDTPTMLTASTQNCTGTPCAITQANVDSYGAVVITTNATGYTVTLGDPTLGASAAGRLIYVTNADATDDFTLSANSGSELITLKPNTTATMIWNGSDWTAAGASSSTDLQAAYDNTATSAGGAELVLNAPGGNADGLTIRNNATTPISGGILEVQSSIGTNLFSVNNLGTELAANGGAETSGTFSTNWTAAPAGGTITRTTTGGQFVTGQAGVQVVTAATANHGVRNNLSGNPVVSTTYQVSFTARLSSGSFTDLQVAYSRDGGTDLEMCTNYSTQALDTAGWTKITCTITTDSTSPSNPDLIIRQATGVARTFWIDNLSFMRNDSTTEPSHVQIGGGINGGPITLFTLDRSSAPPVADGNDTYLGSMYYDTTSGRIQCYEADGWGACGSPPNNIITLTPEYAGSVLNGTGVGTMTADFCANESGILQINDSLCADGEAVNYYSWTSPQASFQTYSIYLTFQLPDTFETFIDDNTITLDAYTTETDDAEVEYEIFRSTGSAITECGSDQLVTTIDDTWQTVAHGGNEASGCSFAGGDRVIFKLNMTARSNASVYVSDINFTYTNE